MKKAPATNCLVTGADDGYWNNIQSRNYRQALSALFMGPFSMPRVQKFQNRFLHLARRVGAGKVFLKFIAGNCQIIFFRLFILRHKGKHGVLVQPAQLAYTNH